MRFRKVTLKSKEIAIDIKLRSSIIKQALLRLISMPERSSANPIIVRKFENWPNCR